MRDLLFYAANSMLIMLVALSPLLVSRVLAYRRDRSDRRQARRTGEPVNWRARLEQWRRAESEATR